MNLVFDVSFFLILVILESVFSLCYYIPSAEASIRSRGLIPLFDTHTMPLKTVALSAALTPTVISTWFSHVSYLPLHKAIELPAQRN